MEKSFSGTFEIFPVPLELVKNKMRFCKIVLKVFSLKGMEKFENYWMAIQKGILFACTKIGINFIYYYIWTYIYFNTLFTIYYTEIWIQSPSKEQKNINSLKIFIFFKFIICKVDFWNFLKVNYIKFILIHKKLNQRQL